MHSLSLIEKCIFGGDDVIRILHVLTLA